MTDKFAALKRVILTHPCAEGQVVVRLESFLEFDAWMDEQLRGLIRRWEHVAPPAARRRQEMLRSRFARGS